MGYIQDIIGHEDIIKHLDNAVAGGKVSHAYIFNGEDGMGKKSLAMALSKVLQCQEQPRPCNQCVSCKQIETANHPDVIFVTHEKTSIGVDDIREQVNADIQIKPYKGPYKIYIIDKAEKLTQQAQNALLKTIEEPPEYALMILLVNNIDAMLGTILSRSVVLNLKPVEKMKVKEFLMTRHHVPDYLAETAATFSGGNVGKAIKYALSGDFERLKGDVLHILKYIDQMELSELIKGVKTISENKSSFEDTIDLMILWYRDVLMFKATNNPDMLLYKEDISLLKRQASHISYEGLQGIIKAMEKAKKCIISNVNPEIAIELMLLNIKENYND